MRTETAETLVEWLRALPAGDYIVAELRERFGHPVADYVWGRCAKEAGHDLWRTARARMLTVAGEGIRPGTVAELPPAHPPLRRCFCTMKTLTVRLTEAQAEWVSATGGRLGITDASVLRGMVDSARLGTATLPMVAPGLFNLLTLAAP